MRRLYQFLKKGSAEVFSYICMLPIIFLLLVMTISLVQLGSLKEKLEYTAYVACRAAAVSETKSDAIKNATEIAADNLKGYTNTYEDGSLKVNITCMGKTGKKTSTWKKGTYIKCDVSVNAKTLISLIKGKKTCSVVMALEFSDD